MVRIALEIESELHPDLLIVYLPGIDRASHQLWGTLEPKELYPENLRPSPSQRKAGAEALRQYYQYTDALVGLLMDRFTSDDLIMVVSDHGFEAGVLLTTLTGMHETDAARDGVIFARGAGIAGGSDPGDVDVHDIAPTVLAWMGLPVGEDMDGEVAGFIGTSAVERIPTHDTGAIERLGGEPSGVNDELIEQLRVLGYVE